MSYNLFSRIDFDNLIFKSDSFNPQIDFVANCKVDGRLLLFRIHGQGPCNITMCNNFIAIYLLYS